MLKWYYHTRISLCLCQIRTSLLSLKLHIKCSKTCRRACESCMCVFVREHSEGTAARHCGSLSRVGHVDRLGSFRLSSRSATMSFAALVITLKSIPHRFTEAPDLYDLLSERKHLQVQAAQTPAIWWCFTRFHSWSCEKRARIGWTCIPCFNASFRRKRATYGDHTQASCLASIYQLAFVSSVHSADSLASRKTSATILQRHRLNGTAFASWWSSRKCFE